MPERRYTLRDLDAKNADGEYATIPFIVRLPDDENSPEARTLFTTVAWLARQSLDVFIAEHKDFDRIVEEVG